MNDLFMLISILPLGLILSMAAPAFFGGANWRQKNDFWREKV